MSIKETVSLGLQVPVARPTRSKRFGMIPQDIMSRPDITPAAKVRL
jgi:hypothetical protein